MPAVSAENCRHAGLSYLKGVLHFQIHQDLNLKFPLFAQMSRGQSGNGCIYLMALLRSMEGFLSQRQRGWVMWYCHSVMLALIEWSILPSGAAILYLSCCACTALMPIAAPQWKPRLQFQYVNLRASVTCSANAHPIGSWILSYYPDKTPPCPDICIKRLICHWSSYIINQAGAKDIWHAIYHLSLYHFSHCK